MLSLPRTFYNNKFHLPPLPPPGSLKGQHVLITGGNTGLGLATAVHCINLGAFSVIITSRNIAKGEAAKASIEAQTQGKGIVKVMHLDMSTFASVQEFAKEVKNTVRNIDFVLLNAGVQNMGASVSQEGWENSLQVNVLSTALLVVLLLPWMKVTGRGKAHLAFTGSGMHRGVDISPKSGWPQEDVLKYWNTTENFKKAGLGMYNISKLLVMYVMREIARLAERSDGSPEVIVSSMCPGMVRSELGREFMTNPVKSLVANAILTALFKTTEGGARTLVYAALTTPDENGKYYTHYQSDEGYTAATEKNIWGSEGQKMQLQVWKEMLNVLEEKVPEVMEIAHPTVS